MGVFWWLKTVLPVSEPLPWMPVWPKMTAPTRYFSFLKGEEGAHPPHPLVADAETVAGFRLVDDRVGTEGDAGIGVERDGADLVLAGHHQLAIEAVVAAEVRVGSRRQVQAALHAERAATVLRLQHDGPRIEADVAHRRTAGVERGGVRRAGERRIIGVIAVLAPGDGERCADAEAVEKLEADVGIRRVLVVDDAARRVALRGRIARDVAGVQRPPHVRDRQLGVEVEPRVLHRTEDGDPILRATWHLEPVQVAGALLGAGFGCRCERESQRGNRAGS